MRAYSQDLRDKVIEQYKNNTMTMMAISKIFMISYQTVCDWVKRYKKDSDYSSKQGVGCGRAVRFTDEAKVLEYLKANPDANAIEIRDAVVPCLPMSTFYDTLDRFGISYKKKNLDTRSEAQWLGKSL
jgi:transposase